MGTGADMGDVPVAIVVSSDGWLRTLVSIKLEDGGFEVLAARDAEHAERLVEHSDPPCVTLVDLTWPDLNGLILARKLRHAQPNMSVSLMTVSIRARRQGAEEGFDVQDPGGLDLARNMLKLVEGENGEEDEPSVGRRPGLSSL